MPARFPRERGFSWAPTGGERGLREWPEGASLCAMTTPTKRAAAAAESDLPKAIGKPATRALAAVGINSLKDLAGRSAAELLALHGVGPKAILVLTETLAERGLPPLR